MQKIFILMTDDTDNLFRKACCISNMNTDATAKRPCPVVAAAATGSDGAGRNMERDVPTAFSPCGVALTGEATSRYCAESILLLSASVGGMRCGTGGGSSASGPPLWNHHTGTGRQRARRNQWDFACLSLHQRIIVKGSAWSAAISSIQVSRRSSSVCGGSLPCGRSRPIPSVPGRSGSSPSMPPCRPVGPCTSGRTARLCWPLPGSLFLMGQWP